jgi:ectoine hydroxylase-related dioxygenase (phytanoyl-CoA dioxygenase family)
MPDEVTWPVVCGFVFMLDDFTDDNGATLVSPGSHRRALNELTTESFAETAVSATGPAGSAIVMDGRVWHAIGKNTTTSSVRHSLLLFYSAPYMRAKENWMFVTPPEVVRSASPELRALLGFKMWRSLGGPPAEGMTVGLAGVSSADGKPMNVNVDFGWAPQEPPWLTSPS